jgi:hypothetical protein
MNENLDSKLISHQGKKLSEDGMCLLISAYHIFDGNASAISRELNLNTNTVCKYLWELSLEPRGHPGRPHLPKQPEAKAPIKSRRKYFEEDILKFVGSYTTYHGNASLAASNLEISLYTMLYYWRAAGLEILKRGRPKIKNEL